jgi:uncharacterized protein (DUF362 family)
MKPASTQIIQRRQFLKLIGLSGLSLLLTKCGLREIVTPTALPVTSATPLPQPTPTRPTPSPVPSSTATAVPTPTYKSMVATGRADSYDPRLLRQELERMLDGIGGLGDLVKSGARVGIKPNLTGGTWTDATLPVPATELYVTHPALVQALAELLIDAGAGQITIMDGLGDPLIFSRWGYKDIAKPLNAKLVDLCVTSPYSDFVTYPVGSKRYIYDVLYMNAALKELDVFISVAKMKCHSTTGVTLSLKNLIGIAPISLYREKDDQNNRSSFHESVVFDTRLPRVAIDLNMARPVHLAIIDGIFTAEGGAGPWDKGLSQVKPGVLVASKDPVAADAVATAIMGFDPSAPSKSHPFTHADNHLALASEVGLGTNHLDEIGISGPQIKDISYPFKTAN